jgi:hypothetical protein
LDDQRQCAVCITFQLRQHRRVDQIAVDWFATRRLCGCSYVVSDESALTGGNWSCKAHGVALGSIQLPFCLIDAKRVGRPIEALEKHFQLATL